MLEQGELPLMRELTSLKKNRGLQHPSTISSWKSPRMGVSPSNAGSNSSNSTLQKVEGNEWEEDCKDYHTIAGGQGEKTKRGSFRSPQFSKGDARLSWDMNKEAFLELDPRHEARGKLRQLENIKRNLEKIRVSGETRVWGNVNVEAGADESSTAESLEEEEDEEEANSSWIIQPNTVGARRCPPQREYARLIKASHRISKKDSFVKQSASTLSPLVLNPQDDLHKLGHHKSLFSLEETYYEELPLEHRALMTGPREVSAMKSESRSHSPFLSQISSKKQATLAKISPTHAFTPAAQACRGSPAPLEAELFEIDPLELPGSKCRKSYTKSTGQGRPLSLDTRRALRRKPDTIYQRTSRSRKVSNSFAYSTMSSMLPKVSLAGPPPLTVPEDDNKSEESIGPLVDGHHHGKLSRGEIPGSLDLEALTASGGHRKGPLVEIADAERLQLAVRESKELVLCEDKPRSLSQKYRPRVFGEIVGQHIVTQSLSNAISKEKIAPVYLFQGPRGTGKTSSARILAAALLCIASQKQRPCGLCKECDLVSSGKNSDVKEVDAASHNGIVKVKALLEEIVLASALSHYKIFIIDECHVLTTETWNALLKVLEEPPMNVVFILITTDPDRLPRTAVSRCQKFPFPKIKDSDIMKRLIKLAGLEHLELDSEVLQLIASRSDGSLRDAEMILDQLSLLGQEVDSSTVYELVGSASDERMLSLLDSALVADTVKTIQRARELVDSGVQPLSLMSQMASLIIDILSGSYKFKDEQRKGFFHRQTLSEDKLERLRKAMKTLSEAEKQLRVSNDKMTWLTAALLQLGPDRSCMFPMSGAGTSVTQSPIIFDDAENDTIDINYISPLQHQYWLNDANPNQKQTPEDFSTSKSELVMLSADEQEKIVSVDRPMMFSDVQEELFRNKDHEQANKASLMVSSNDLRKEHLLIPGRLDDIWFRVVQSCRPFRLRQSLHGHGKLVSISLSEVDAVVLLEFCHPEHKTRCARSQKTIVNMFEAVLGFPVQVEIGLVSVLGADQPGCTTCNLADCSGKEGFVREGNEILGYEKTMLSVGVSGSTLQSAGTECFPATPQAPSDSASKDLQCLRTGSPDWNRNNLSCMNKGDLRMEGSNCVKANILSCISTETKPLDVKLSSEEQLDSAWINDAERFSPSSLSAYGTDAAKMQHSVSRYQSESCQHQASLSGMLASENHCMQELDYTHTNGGCCEDLREIVELDILSPISHGCGLCDDLEEESRKRKGDINGCYGPRSSNAGSQKTKGSALKMVHRLTLRSRNRSLPGSCENSPDERGSPGTGFQDSRMVKESKHVLYGAEQVEDSTKAGCSALPEPPKKSKLKGAAGSFARFLQGKLIKNPHDTIGQCI